MMPRSQPQRLTISAPFDKINKEQNRKGNAKKPKENPASLGVGLGMERNDFSGFHNRNVRVRKTRQ